MAASFFDFKNVIVLLATYNGEKFLAQQIESIQAQNVSSWTLLVRDDGSIDGTKKILSKCAAEDPRIHIVEDELGRLGPTKNFGALMRTAESQASDIVFFADQDDVWLPDKMFKQLQSLYELESRHGSGIPLLTYSDMEVVDVDLRRIHHSFMLYQRQRHEPRNPIHVLLTQNYVAGCTVAINRQLLEFASPIPDEIQLHDWWLAVCAAACGRISYIDEPLVRYRQHSSNQVGAVTVPGIFNLFAPLYRKRLSKPQLFMLRPILQAAALNERLAMRKVDCSSDVRRVIDALASCGEAGVLRRLATVYRLPLRRQGRLRKLLWFARLLCSRRQPKAKALEANRSMQASK
jgi:glycosyltransferase involved in cell wall biosynthesis